MSTYDEWRKKWLGSEAPKSAQTSSSSSGGSTDPDAAYKAWRERNGVGTGYSEYRQRERAAQAEQRRINPIIPIISNPATKADKVDQANYERVERGDKGTLDALYKKRTDIFTGYGADKAQAVAAVDKEIAALKAKQKSYQQEEEARSKELRLRQKQAEITNYNKYAKDPNFMYKAVDGKAKYERTKAEADAAENSLAAEIASAMNPDARISANTYIADDDARIEKMREGEKNIYFYLLSSQGKEAAKKYLDLLSDTLNARIGEENAKVLQDNNLGGLVAPVAGAYSAVEGTMNLIGGVLGKESLTSAMQQTSRAVRGNLSGVEGTLYDLAYTAGNMAPSMAISAATVGLGAPGQIASALGSATFGTSAAGNKYKQALDEGYSRDQALSYGLLTGASEAGLQYVLGGISKLGLGKVSGAVSGKVSSALSKIIKNQNIVDGISRLVGSMGSEGAEEYLQEVLDPVFKNVAAGEHNDINLISEEALYSGLLGALTGGLFEGFDMASGAINNRAETPVQAVTVPGGETIADVPAVPESAVLVDERAGISANLSTIESTNTGAPVSSVRDIAAAKGYGDNTQVSDEVRGAFAQRAGLRREMDRMNDSTTLPDYEKALVDQAIKGNTTLESFAGHPNYPEMIEYYNTKKRYSENERVINQYRAQHRNALMDEANDAISNSDAWTDKKSGLWYAIETQERNIRDIVGSENAADAENINRIFFEPIHENEAAKTRFNNENVKAVRELNLTKDERVRVQTEGEKADIIERMQSLEKTGKTKTKTYKMYLAQLDKIAQVERTIDYGKVDVQKVADALTVFRKLYNNMYYGENDAYIRNGYNPIEYRKNYFPHFITEEPSTEFQKFAQSMGFKLEDMELPTSIAGLTETFTPGRTWFGNIKKRTGVDTTYDAVEGFERYLRGASDVIFHTDDIQRLRSLETAIRYKYSDEGIKNRIKEVEADESLNPDERYDKISALLDESQHTKLSNYVQNLHEYTNLLANKASKIDRSIETLFGRRMYALGNWYQNRMAANMVAVNPGSWITNFIPLTQAWSEVGSGNMIKGMVETMRGYANGSDFADQSTFLTNRFGTETLTATPLRKVTDTLAKPFQWIDNFTAESVVRSKYYENIEQGMTHGEAMKNADAFAASVMADRSKGAMPTLHGAKNPIVKMFTVFQLEAKNQLSFAFKDVPRDLKERGLRAIAVAFFKMFLGAWMYNEIYEKITGRRAAFDPINIIGEAIGDFSGVAKGEKKLNEAITNTYGNVMDNIPYIGSVLGGEGGRLPVANALPDITGIVNAASQFADKDTSNAKAAQTLWDAVKGPISYILPPVGGGQVKKVAEGISTVAQGGSYKLDNEGNKQLQFRTDQTPLDYLQAALFGKWSLPEGREYIESGFPIVNAKDTEAYRAAMEAGIDGSHFMLLRSEIKAIEPVKDRITGQTIQSATEQARILLYNDATLTPEQKRVIDKALIGSAGWAADYSSKEMFELSLNKDAWNRYQVNIRRGMTSEEAIRVESYRKNFIGKDGNYEKGRKALMADQTLTAEQKSQIDKSYTDNPADYSSPEMFELSLMGGSIYYRAQTYMAADERITAGEAVAIERYRKEHKTKDEMIDFLVDKMGYGKARVNAVLEAYG